MSQLEIKRFDMKSIVFQNSVESEGPVIVMIGKRGTGKSMLVKDLLFHHKVIPVGTVISGTEIGNHFYASIIPRLFIHHSYESEIVQKVLQRQRIALRQCANTNTKSIDPRTLLILDDCLFDDKWSRDKLMKLVFLNGRHWKVLLIITMQYPLGIPPLLRSNVDYTFILREDILGNRKRIYDNYTTAFPSFEYFCQILGNTTENYECLVIKNGGNSNKLHDQVFWYKAEIHQKFRLGSKEIWDLSDSMAFDDDDEDIFKTDKKAQTKLKVSIKKTN
jgi:hypothetical protein